MKILKHGNLKPRKFICHHCDCEFVADTTEYCAYECNGNPMWYFIDCPECGNKTETSEPWKEQENDSKTSC